MIELKDLRFEDIQIVRMGIADYVWDRGLGEEYLPMPGTEVYFFYDGEWVGIEGWHTVVKTDLNILKYTNIKGKQVLLEIETVEVAHFYRRNYQQWKAEGDFADLIEAYREKCLNVLYEMWQEEGLSPLDLPHEPKDPQGS